MEVLKFKFNSFFKDKFKAGCNIYYTRVVMLIEAAVYINETVKASKPTGNNYIIVRQRTQVI